MTPSHRSPPPHSTKDWVVLASLQPCNSLSHIGYHASALGQIIRDRLCNLIPQKKSVNGRGSGRDAIAFFLLYVPNLQRNYLAFTILLTSFLVTWSSTQTFFGVVA